MVKPATASVRIASRGSELALWQAHAVRNSLARLRSDLTVEIEVIRTTGDRILDVPLARIGDRGLFTKEIDAALLEGRADLAVHSLKDVPTRLPDGLMLAGVMERADPRDVLLVRAGMPRSLKALPAGARIGTSSLRRRSQLRALRRDLEVLDLRGNLNTRLARLDAGEYEGILLAAAGVIRLGWADRVSEYLEVVEWLPAVGQGALGLVTRADDVSTAELLEPLGHPDTTTAVLAERGFLNALEGGCQVPIAALATVHDHEVRIRGLVADLDGVEILRDEISGAAGAADALGRELAARLASRGADRVLDAVRRASEPPPVPPP